MVSRVRTMVLVAGLALLGLTGLSHVSQQVRNAVRIAASAVWGS